MQLAEPDALKDALKAAPRDHHIYLAGCTGEPTATLDALAADPELGAGRRFTGVWLPGVNTRSVVAEGASADVFFVTPALREAFAASRVRHRPLGYPEIWRWLGQEAGRMTAFVSVTPPRNGQVGLGPTADFTPAIVAGGARLIGEVNPELPEPVNGIRIPVDRFDLLVDAPNAPILYDTGAGDPTVDAIADAVAAMIDDGDTVQFGIGRVQAALAHRLAGHRDLAVHGGMITASLTPALESGAVSRGVVTGVALGSQAFYRLIAARDDIRFKPASFTHGAGVLAGIDRLFSVASALEIDLFGQVNAEMAGGRQVSGHGGIADFARGAMASPGGRSIVALPATAKRGTVSRIKPVLGPDAVCSIARGDVDIVVTEHGVARLRGFDIDQRAQSLIAIAAPGFRDDLADQWSRMRARL